VIWPYGYGAGSSTIADWIEENVKADSRLEGQLAPLDTATSVSSTQMTLTPGSARSVTAGQRRPLTPGVTGSAPTTALNSLSKAQSTQEVAPSQTSTDAPSQTPRTPRRSTASVRSRSEGPNSAGPMATRSPQEAEGSRQESLAAALCTRTNRRIQQILLHELEEKLIKEVAFLTACLHYWRTEVIISSARSGFDESLQAKSAELLQSEQNFQAHIAKLEAFHNQKLQSAADERRAKRKRMFELLFAEWAEGDALGLLHIAWRCWSEARTEWHALQLHKERAFTFGSVLSRFADGEQDGLIRLAMYAWQEYCREYVQAHQHQAIVERMALRWYEFEEGSLQAMFMTWKGLTRQHRLALRTVELGAPRAMLIQTFRAWLHVLQAAWASAAKLAVIKKVAYRWAEGSTEMVVRGAFNAMALEARHNNNLRKYQTECQDYLNGVRAEHEAAEKERQTAAQRRKEKAHNSVEVLVAQWGRGQQRGLLQTVTRHWKAYAHHQKVHARSKESVHVAIQKALEGPERGLKHSCFGHWKTESLNAKHEQRREEQEAQQRSAFERLLVDERQRHADELGHYKNKAEELRLRAISTVREAILKWSFGDGKGLGIEVFRDWAKVVKEAKQHGRMRQAVHGAILSALAGKEKGSMQMCFKNWVALRRKRPSKAVQLILAKWLEGNERGLLDSVVSAWHQLCHSRLQHIQARFMMVQMMVGKDSRAALLECFLAWQAAWQEFLHEQRHQDLLAGHEQQIASWEAFHKRHLEAHFRRGEAYLCRDTFWQWHSQARKDHHDREVTEAREQRQSLEDQLVMAYAQIDTITETLQKELQSKEELAAKLQEAYAQLRRRNLAASPGSIQQEVDELTATRKSLGGRTTMMERVSAAASEVPTVAARDSVASRKSLPPIASGEDGETCNWDNAVDRLTHGGMDDLAHRPSNSRRKPSSLL